MRGGKFVSSVLSPLTGQVHFFHRSICRPDSTAIYPIVVKDSCGCRIGIKRTNGPRGVAPGIRKPLSGPFSLTVPGTPGHPEKRLFLLAVLDVSGLPGTGRRASNVRRAACRKMPFRGTATFFMRACPQAAPEAAGISTLAKKTTVVSSGGRNRSAGTARPALRTKPAQPTLPYRASSISADRPRYRATGCQTCLGTFSGPVGTDKEASMATNPEVQLPSCDVRSP